ncbi:MAG: S9 family peptidase [Gammaproteobacteria bacterium]|nr:S9 family peptidase [Gammaproteobacteria bacterium]
MLLRRGLALAALLVAVQPAAAGDIAAALAFEHAQDLVAAPASGRIAWTTNELGTRAVWTAASPDYTPQRIVAFEGDDGAALADLALSADGRIVVFSRNADAGRPGRPVNVESRVQPPAEKIWLARLGAGGAFHAEVIAQGTQPVLAPDGGALVWLAAGAVQHRRLDEPKASTRVLIEATARIARVVFSPDGRSLAVVSARGAHSLVGVLAPDTPAIRWLAPDLSRDDFPAWSPDSTRVAFLRFPGRRFADRFPMILEVEPFSLWVADVRSAAARAIWSSPGADGGYAQETGLPLAWSAGGRIVFQSEHDGWLRPWAIDPDGRNLVALSQGPCETDAASLDPDTERLLHAGNCGDPARRHVWQSDLATGRMTALTSGSGIEWQPVALGSGRGVAFLVSTAAEPFGVAVQPAAPGAGPRRISGAARAAELTVPPQEVAFRADDGLELHAQLFPARARTGERRPALVFVHGGPHRQMLPGWHPMRYYSITYALNQYFAANGYVVLALNFRSGVGYGRDFRQAPGRGALGASEHRDLLAAAAWLRARPDVDPARIAIWGGSYGGLLTALALARSSDLFAAGVDLHGVHDWSQYGFSQVGLNPWPLDAGEQRMLHAASPVADVNGWRSPVLVVTGDDDSAVNVRQSVDLVARLRERGVAVETLLLPDEEHDLRRHASWLAVARAMEDFLRRRLAARGE